MNSTPASNPLPQPESPPTPTGTRAAEAGTQRHLAAERERAAQAVRAGEQRLATFAAATFEGIAESEAGRLVDCNEQLTRMLGYTVAELKGLAILDLTAPEDRDRVRANLDGNRESVIEHAMLRKDGTRIIVEAHGRPAQPGSRARHTALRDITARKQAEERLRESEARLQQAQSAAALGIYDHDLRTGRIRWDDRVRELWGVGSDDPVTYGVFFAGLHPEDRGATQKAMEQALSPAGTRHFAATYRVLHRTDGRERWIESTGRVFFEQDLAVRMVGTVLDISGRKRAEDQLRELSQRLTYHVDHSPLAVIEWGPDMRLTRWSREAERVFGWSADEVLGKRMEDFRWVYQADVAQVAGVSADLQTGGDPHRFSLNRNYRKDGSVVWCEWYNSSLQDDSGKLRSILSLVLDVTARKQAEAELRTGNEELERFNRGMVGRELRLIEMKREVNELCARLGLPKRYPLAFDAAEPAE